MIKYVAITPARDEERLLPGLIDSMATQTILPRRWIIVNDGSADSTRMLLDRAAQKYPWIEAHHLEPVRARAQGGESVVMPFLRPAVVSRYDYVLRVDADITFASNFTESILSEFARDPELGIAGAGLWELRNERWHEVVTPAFHTRGAVKFYSAECFKAIGGLDSGLGWDTIDEATAMMLGFRTRCFRHIRACHHRPQGQAGGRWRADLALGRAAYRSGYSPAFMMARAGSYAFARPFAVGSILMLAGFLDGYLRRLPRAAPPEVIRFVRRQQRRRLLFLESVWR
jgi:biofilm PGA synthesis N-glycosyltransferase PgaC